MGIVQPMLVVVYINSIDGVAAAARAQRGV